MCDSQGKPVIICKTDQPIQCMSIQRSTVILGLKGSACKSFPLSHVAASAENKTGVVSLEPSPDDTASKNDAKMLNRWSRHAGDEKASYNSMSCEG